MEEPRSDAEAAAPAGAAGAARSRVSSGDLPFIDAVEDQDCGRRSRPPSRGGDGSRRPSRSPAPPRGEGRASRRSSRATDGEDEAPGSRRPSRSHAPARGDDRGASRRSSRATDGEDERPGSRRPSRSPAPAPEGDPEPDAGARPPSRRGSTAPGSRQASRRASRAFLDVDYDGRRRSSSRRGSHSVDLAEVVMSELRRPTRRSSRAIALELGEIVSVEVRRESRAGSRGSAVEEVRAQVRRQSLTARGARPSLLTQRGSRAATSDDEDDLDYYGDERYPKDEYDDDDDDEGNSETDDASASQRSGPGQLEQGSRIPQYVAAIVVNLASFCNGVTFGWPSVALPLLQSRMSPVEGSPLDDEESSWLASTIAISACLSTPFWLMLNDRYGRKSTGYLVALAFALHWIVLGVTRNAVCLYTARALGGLGTAGCFAVCPTYAKEISEDAIRGALGIVFTIMFNLGVLVAYGVGAAVSYKGVNILGMSFVLLFVISFWQLPETPVHLLAKGRNHRAARSLQWLRGKGADIMDELSALRKANKRRRQEGDATLFEVLSDRASFKGIIITSVLCANQPMCGIAVVLSYTVNIFMDAGVNISPYMATIIVGVLLVISSYGASHMVDRAGRKIMLLISNVGLAICLGALGLYFFIKHLGIDTDSLHLGWLPIASLSLFVVFVSLGVAPLPFVIITEIFLPQAQRIASTVGYIIIWGLTFICMKFFTNIANAVGLFSCYWIFAAYCVLMCAFVQIYVPETKGRSLDSILDELSGEEKPLLIVQDKERNNYGV